MPKYFAKEAGHLGRYPVQVMRNKRLITEAYILPGDIFEWNDEPGAWMELYTGQELAMPEGQELPRTMSELQAQMVPELPEEITGEKTKNQIIAELRGKGISFNVASRKEELIALLEDK